jgi:hypothetical protein
MKSTKSSISAIRSAGQRLDFLDQGFAVGGHVRSFTRLLIAFYKHASPLPVPRPVSRCVERGKARIV